MARIGSRQVLITVVLVVVALASAAPAAGPALRPTWLQDPVAGLPLSAWLLLILIVLYLIAVRIISAILFTDRSAEENRS